MMKQLKREPFVRSLLSLAILLSGIALIPFVGRPTSAIGWKLFAGIYTPELAVNETIGAPGSVFAFTGGNYPPLSQATIYVNGQARGAVTTDAAGQATFQINTAGAAPGQYSITMEVDINASATNGFELVEGGGIVSPPAGFTGPIIFVAGEDIYLPIIVKQ
jgi:hypothetical protein